MLGNESSEMYFYLNACKKRSDISANILNPHLRIWIFLYKKNCKLHSGVNAENVFNIYQCACGFKYIRLFRKIQTSGADLPFRVFTLLETHLFAAESTTLQH